MSTVSLRLISEQQVTGPRQEDALNLVLSYGLPVFNVILHHPSMFSELLYSMLPFITVLLNLVSQVINPSLRFMLRKGGKSNKLEGRAQSPELLTRPDTNDVKYIPNIQNNSQYFPKIPALKKKKSD